VSGHSKWASIKHKKGKEDAKRGQMFSKLTKVIMVAAKGGSNPDANAALAAAIEKAKEYNMPADTIERAIKKGAGELGGQAFETIVYEGYGPAGTAVIVDTLTDNRNRTAADIRNIFSRHGANLGTTGSVSWMFEKKGVIYINKSDEIDEDELLNIALEAGADDINIGENNY
jgi:YebC/PmpR family DNA-binding regulatory protein